MAAIHPTDSTLRRRALSRANTAKDLVLAVHTPQFSGTHAARLALLLPWVLSAFMPSLQQLYILYPISFSSPVPLADTSMGTDFHLFIGLLGSVALMWSQMLEARRRQKVPSGAGQEVRSEGAVRSRQSLTAESRWASALGGCTTKDPRSIRVWSRFDCAEAACVCACVTFGTLLTKYPFTLASRIAYAIAYVPFTFVLLSIFKRMVDAVVYTQGKTFPSWVTATANPVFFKAVLFEVAILLMWQHASIYTPYPKSHLERALSVMLDEGDNYAILCEDEAVFWESFSLPFKWHSSFEPLDCDEPTCGYTSWRDLCEARRLAPLAEQTKDIIHYQLVAVPVLLILALNLIGNGHMTRRQNGELNLVSLLAPHILLILGLGLCTLFVGIYFMVMLPVQVPLLMSNQAPTDPRVCMPSSACGLLWNAAYLGFIAVGLLPIDTLGRFLKQRNNRSRSYFLSYKQNDGNDGAVQMLANGLRDHGAKKVWLDKLAEDRSEKGMVEGVKTSDVFIAIVSPAYFESEFCCLEMHTAFKEDKPVLVVWNQSKHMVQSALGWLPGELSFLKNNELLPIQEDIQMAETCANRILAATATAFTLKPEDVPAVETFQQEKKDQASGSSTLEQRLKFLEDALRNPLALGKLEDFD